MVKLSIPPLKTVHFLTLRFIQHSSATELFASVQQVTIDSVAIVLSIAHKLCSMIAHALHRKFSL